MLATSLQQWARRYNEVSHRAGRSFKERAQIHSFLASGITKFHFNPMVQALPAMVHLSLFIFFAGLLIYLFNINHVVFSAVVCCVVLSLAVYGTITFMPFIWLDSPYYSPLTQPAWFLCTRLSYVILSRLYRILLPFFSFRVHYRIRKWMELCRQQKVWGNLLVFLNAISKQSAEINFRILQWTVYDLYEGDELEKVFESIPSFLKSEKVTRRYTEAQDTIENAMSQFVGNTVLSDTVPESVKLRRLIKCLNVARQVLLPVPSVMFHGLVELDWGGAPHSLAIGKCLRTWDEGSDRRFSPYIRGVIAVIIAKVRERNVLWATFASHNLPTSIPEIVFQDWSTHSNSVLLANLVHFTRRANRFEPFSIAVVRLLAKFNIHDTLPDPQHDFCAMWNELVQEAQNGGKVPGNIPVALLSEIRDHYTALHQGADAAPPEYLNASGSLAGPLDDPSSYPLCGVHGHPFSAALAFPHDTRTQPADEPTIHAMPTPIIQSSYPPPAMPQPYPNPVIPSDSPANTSSQTTARHPTISSVMTSDLDHPTSVTMSIISIPQPTFPLLAGSATAAVSPSPPLIPTVPFSPSPPSLPNRITPTSSPPFPMPSFSGSNQAPSDHGIPSSSLSTAIPPIPPFPHQSSSGQDSMTASSAAKDGAPDKSSV